MAAPAPRRARVDPPPPARTRRVAPPTEAPSYERALRQARARRRARIEHQRELRRARVRFLFLLVGLVLLTAFLALSIWEKAEALFGL
jgi:hypothetical protein